MTEELIPGNIKGTGIAQHHPGASDTYQESTFRYPHNTKEAEERHIAIEIQEGTASEVYDFKDKWETSALIIDVHKHSLHIILDVRNNPGHPEDQEAYIN